MIDSDGCLFKDKIQRAPKDNEETTMNVDKVNR